MQFNIFKHVQKVRGGLKKKLDKIKTLAESPLPPPPPPLGH